MILDLIREFVFAHYSSSAEPLLLSYLGDSFKKNGKWPIAGEERPLSDIIETMRGEITLIRDPDAPAYVAVAPVGKEHLVEKVIAERKIVRRLSKIAKSLLVAFCVRSVPGGNVYVQSKRPFQYHVGLTQQEGDLLIDEEFRMPGLYIGDVTKVSVADATELLRRIEVWAQKNKVDTETFHVHGSRAGSTPVEMPKIIPPAEKGNSALERLYAAQPDGMSQRLVIPMDIAIYLSRIS